MNTKEKKQVIQKCEELLDVHKEHVMREIRKYMTCHAVPLEDFDPEQYILPRILVTAGLRCSTEAVHPPDNNARILSNLKHF